MNFPKLIMVFLNVAALATVLWQLFKFGLPRGDDAWIVIPLTAAPIVTLFYHIIMDRNPNRDPSLLALEIEVRKAKLQNELKTLRGEEKK